MSTRIVRTNKNAAKPSKPHKDIPLTAHASGKWCRKVKGRIYYFGEWADPDAAMREWMDRKESIRCRPG